MKYISSPYLVRGYNFKAENKQNSVFNYLNDRPYLVDNMEQDALNYCKDAIEDSKVINKFGQKVIDKLVRSFLLLSYNTVWNQNHASHIEIETSTVCNWRCGYCPVKYNPRKSQYMDMQVFERIIDRAVEYKNIKYITLHSYNEPTIDPNFFSYIAAIEKTNLKLVLYTNGSGLDDTKLNKIKQLKNLRNIVVTIPSINPEKFNRMTGSNDYWRTTLAIKKARSMDINVRLSVQGLGNDEHVAEVEELKKAFPDIQCTQHASFDRTGTLKNEYWQNIYVDTDYLYGCRSYMEIVTVNIKGEVFICCNDFLQKNILGNLLDIPLKELLSGSVASQYRREIWGGVKAPVGHICRKCFLMQNTKTLLER